MRARTNRHARREKARHQLARDGRGLGEFDAWDSNVIDMRICDPCPCCDGRCDVMWCQCFLEEMRARNLKALIDEIDRPLRGDA